MKLLEVLSRMKRGDRAENSRGYLVVKKLDIGDSLRAAPIALWSDETLLGDDWEIERPPKVKRHVELTGVEFIRRDSVVSSPNGGFVLASDQRWLTTSNLEGRTFTVTLEWEE